MVSQLTELTRTQLGLETLSMIVHLPLYLKLDNDYVGAARILSVLAELYGLPMEQMPEIRMGETQYSQVQIFQFRQPAISAAGSPTGAGIRRGRVGANRRRGRVVAGS